MTDKLTGHVVSHTHWDRAWYWTFEQTRVRLLDLMDDLLDLMQREAGYRHFVLDGQLAMVQDYLALRPERREQLQGLARAGRLLVGPFFVLPDLFIPTGESLVRNLRTGQREAGLLGLEVMQLGYLPDPFGHPAQLPQVLAGFGIEGMLFSRGMGDEHERLGADFLWEAPDGTRVLATHQIGGYGNLERFGRPPAASARDDNPALDRQQALDWAERRVRELVELMAPHCPAGQLLLNNGCDHLPAQPELPELIALVNRRLDTIRLRHSTPLAYQRAVRRSINVKGLRPRVHRGELRGARFANLLPGVLSARVDLKLTHDRCERALLRRAEPWSGLARSLGLGRDDRALLEHAWRLLLLCQPHDDICGCSIDRVHEDDLGRMARVLELAEGVEERALRVLCRAIPADRDPAWVAFNSCAWPVTRVVELAGLRGRGAAGPSGPLPVQRTRGGKLALVELPPHGFVRLQGAPLPGQLEPGAVQVREGRGKTTINNDLVQIEVLHERGHLRLRDLQSGLTYRRVGQLSDEGDAGDTYDFSPPDRQRVVRGPTRYRRVRVLERGPLRARLRLDAALILPRGLTRDRRRRSRQTRRLPLRLELTLCAGSPLLQLDLSLTNRADDHRLRWTLEAPFVADELVCGAPFQVLRRPLRPKDRPAWYQRPAAYQPFQDVVALEQPTGGGIALLAPGLREVEGQALRRGTRLDLTLLRAVGWLSRDDLATRRDEAGPCFEVQGARHVDQQLSFSLGLLPYAGSWLEAEVPRRHDELAAPPEVLPLTGADQGNLPPALALLEVQPSMVRLCALGPRADGKLEARLVNLSGRKVRARLLGPYRARRLGLDGRPRRGKVDLSAIPLRAGEIVTLELTRRG